ncbi:rCG44081, isoform CRA_a [Rattus norvegicus]|uniref:RCG44081, isoform CRA_a n=1 Tax=Rattus norvegicus TaxID=10116 RepID=A6J6S1_RAT|nr:rCG44081, isoform CRA_a [Rattus norvegicus]
MWSRLPADLVRLPYGTETTLGLCQVFKQNSCTPEFRGEQNLGLETKWPTLMPGMVALGRQRQESLCDLRLVCSTEYVPEQPEL